MVSCSPHLQPSFALFEQPFPHCPPLYLIPTLRGFIIFHGPFKSYKNNFISRRKTHIRCYCCIRGGVACVPVARCEKDSLSFELLSDNSLNFFQYLELTFSIPACMVPENQKLNHSNNNSSKQVSQVEMQTG